MDLTGTQRRKLHQALLGAFPTRPELARMVSFTLDESLNSITSDVNLSQCIFDLITWAEARDKVRDLLLGACTDNPTNAELYRVAVELGIEIPPAPVMHRSNKQPDPESSVKSSSAEEYLRQMKERSQIEDFHYTENVEYKNRLFRAVARGKVSGKPSHLSRIIFIFGIFSSLEFSSLQNFAAEGIGYCRSFGGSIVDFNLCACVALTNNVTSGVAAAVAQSRTKTSPGGIVDWIRLPIANWIITPIICDLQTSDLIVPETSLPTMGYWWSFEVRPFLRRLLTS